MNVNFSRLRHNPNYQPNIIQGHCSLMITKVKITKGDTVKPFVCEFRKLNKTTQLKDMNIDTVPTLIGITRVGIAA